MPILSTNNYSKELSSEIIEEILLRCSAKSLVRFMCVSKSWHSFILNPNFISRHRNHNLIINPNDNPLLFVRKHNDQLPRYRDIIVMAKDFTLHVDMQATYPIPYIANCVRSFYDYNYGGSMNLVGISNGMICFYDNVFPNTTKNYYLWNFAIRKYVKLPYPSFIPRTNDDMYRRHGVGFWYDKDTDDYKLIRVVNCPPVVGELFELKKNSWRTINFHLEWYLENVGVFFNGVFHWLGSTKESYMWKKPPSLIVFDVKEEKFEEMKLPMEFKSIYLQASLSLVKRINGARIGILGGYFCVGLSYTDFLEIWVMKVYGEQGSWTRQYKLKNESMVVIGMSLDEKSLLVFSDEKLMEYDAETDQLTCLVTQNNNIFPSMFDFGWDNYVETLTLLDSPPSCLEPPRRSKKNKPKIENHS